MSASFLQFVRSQPCLAQTQRRWRFNVPNASASVTRQRQIREVSATQQSPHGNKRAGDDAAEWLAVRAQVGQTANLSSALLVLFIHPFWEGPIGFLETLANKPDDFLLEAKTGLEFPPVYLEAHLSDFKGSCLEKLTFPAPLCGFF